MNFTNRHDPVAAGRYREVDQGSVTRELVGLAGLADTTDDRAYKVEPWMTAGASSSEIARAAVPLDCQCRRPWLTYLAVGLVGYLIGR